MANFTQNVLQNLVSLVLASKKNEKWLKTYKTKYYSKNVDIFISQDKDQGFYLLQYIVSVTSTSHIATKVNSDSAELSSYQYQGTLDF